MTIQQLIEAMNNKDIELSLGGDTVHIIEASGSYDPMRPLGKSLHISITAKRDNETHRASLNTDDIDLPSDPNGTIGKHVIEGIIRSLLEALHKDIAKYDANRDIPALMQDIAMRMSFFLIKIVTK